MPHEIKEQILAFWSGAATGGSYGLYLLNVEWVDMVYQVPLRIAFGVLIAFFSGIAGIAGKELYEYLKAKSQLKILVFAAILLVVTFVTISFIKK
jgi:hypothetical protein